MRGRARGLMVGRVNGGEGSGASLRASRRGRWGRRRPRAESSPRHNKRARGPGAGGGPGPGLQTPSLPARVAVGRWGARPGPRRGRGGLSPRLGVMAPPPAPLQPPPSASPPPPAPGRETFCKLSWAGEGTSARDAGDGTACPGRRLVSGAAGLPGRRVGRGPPAR